MMANAFKTSIAGLEKELEALITDNQIQVPMIFNVSLQSQLDAYSSRSREIISPVIS